MRKVKSFLYAIILCAISITANAAPPDTCRACPAIDAARTYINTYIQVNGAHKINAQIHHDSDSLMLEAIEACCLTSASSVSYRQLTDTPSLSPIAHSGSYNDLADKPGTPSLYSVLRAGGPAPDRPISLWADSLNARIGVVDQATFIGSQIVPSGLKFSSAGGGGIITTDHTGNPATTKWTFPGAASGVVPMRVNGISANTSGNIILPQAFIPLDGELAYTTLPVGIGIDGTDGMLDVNGDATIRGQLRVVSDITTSGLIEAAAISSANGITGSHGTFGDIAVNAGATIDGIISTNAGLILQANSETILELASVNDAGFLQVSKLAHPEITSYLQPGVLTLNGGNDDDAVINMYDRVVGGYLSIKTTDGGILLKNDYSSNEFAAIANGVISITDATNSDAVIFLANTEGFKTAPPSANGAGVIKEGKVSVGSDGKQYQQVAIDGVIYYRPLLTALP